MPGLWATTTTLSCPYPICSNITVFVRNEHPRGSGLLISCTMSDATMIEIYVDADACPVKDEIYRVADRHNLKVYIVSNAFMRLPQSPLIERVLVEEGPDVADDWITEHASPTDIAITADIPLAARCVRNGVTTISPVGKPFTDDNIGLTLATRNLMTDLRETSNTQTYNAAFSAKDRSTFLQALENAVQALKRADGHRT